MKTGRSLAALMLFALATCAGCSAKVYLGDGPDGGTHGGGSDAAAEEQIPTTHTGKVEKVDLLFVVDNSISMADKQAELARRVPEMIRALLDPAPDPVTGKPRWEPVRDLHVAFITSSLGSYGTSPCAVEITNRMNDDRAHLLPRAADTLEKGYVTGPTGPVETACAAMVSAATLHWVADPSLDPTASFVGNDAIKGLEAAASCVVAAAREQGCGYEATMEAMYRFLVEPAPYSSAKVACSFEVSGDVCSGEIQVSGGDDALLAQRRAFLRPDSLVAIVILSDENDASFRASAKNWIPQALGKGTMPRGTAGCANVPGDADDLDAETLRTKYACQSCEDAPTDPACAAAWSGGDRDGRNVRAFDNARRFGRSFLYPVSRYVDGLTRRNLVGADGVTAPNPLFVGGKRTLDMVLLAGIVGVPRALVASSDGSPRTLSPADWDRIAAGDPKLRDPHMVESITPRAGVPKFAGDRTIDPINGGDRDVPDLDDLQYACIAKRATAGTSECASGTSNPICDSPTVQLYMKAYPGLRVLRAVRALGARGHVASICAESYASVVAGLADKIHRACAARP